MRNRTLGIIAGLMVLVVLCVLAPAVAKEYPSAQKPSTSPLMKTTGSPFYAVLAINNINTWQRSDGWGNHSPAGDNGVYYPKGTGNVVYQDGIEIGGKVYLDGTYNDAVPAPFGQRVRVVGNSYSNVGWSFRTGWVEGTGAAARAISVNDPNARMFRIRRDYYGMTENDARGDAASTYEKLAGDVSETEMAALRAQYALDWDQWPVDRGAPYIERNGTAGYQKPPAFSATFTVDSLSAGSYDEPGVAGADPNSTADQIMWCAYNDLEQTQAITFGGSYPIGVEIQVTTWMYARTDAMGNNYFKRVRFHNRGGVPLDGSGTLGSYYMDSVYVCQWSDIDLGDSGDDLVGCDSVLSLGFVYNGQAQDATFAKFGLTPPASGYDFLAGPTVDGLATDSAIVDFKRVGGKKNLPMTSFAFFSAGTAWTDPNIAGRTNGGIGDYPVISGGWWNLLRGYTPVGRIGEAPTPYPFPAGTPYSKFVCSGDPAAGTGFLDGVSPMMTPGDRRILLNTGPFRFNPGETQEMYIAFVCAIGADYLSSVNVMKAYDQVAQETFDLQFRVAKPPKTPNPSWSALDEAISLTWDEPGTVTQTEGAIADPGQYQFQGYNIYQFPRATSTLADAKRVATFDVVDDQKVILDTQFDLTAGKFLQKPVQYGSDAGVKRYFVLDKDYITGNGKLWNGNDYYVGVSAYSITLIPGYAAALESKPSVLKVRPQRPLGTRLSNNVSSDAIVNITAGSSDYMPALKVVDPLKTVTRTYGVSFADSSGTTWWHLKDKGTNSILYSSSNLGAGISGVDNDDYQFPIIDGILWEMKAQAGQFVTDSTMTFDGAYTHWMNPGKPSQLVDGGYFGRAGEPAFGGIVTFGEQYGNYFGAMAPTELSAAAFPVLLKFGPGNGQKAYRLYRSGTGSTYAIQTDVRAGAPAGESFVNFPFSAWDVSNPASPRQLTITWRDQIRDALWTPGIAAAGLEFVMIMNMTYDPLGQQYQYPANPVRTGPVINSEATIGALAPITYFVSLMASSASVASRVSYADSIAAGELLIRPLLGFNPNLALEVPIQAATVSQDLKVSDAASRVNVFPNPYYAVNPAEISRFSKFVTFSNLPNNVKIRIFNLAGQLVKTLTKNDNEQFLAWDLLNENRFPVGSGMYIAHVDMPDLGITKALKFMILQEQELLDWY